MDCRLKYLGYADRQQFHQALRRYENSIKVLNVYNISEYHSGQSLNTFLSIHLDIVRENREIMDNLKARSCKTPVRERLEGHRQLVPCKVGGIQPRQYGYRRKAE